MEEHMPNPYPLEDWSEEDHIKFKAFSNHCLMCNYKYMYAQLQHLLQTMAHIDDVKAKEMLMPQVYARQTALLELGLFIASAVDESNKLAGQAEHN
jgi:hypothetical protein